VVTALGLTPPEQLKTTLPPTMGAPTAAIPSKVTLLAGEGVVAPPSLSLPQAVSPIVTLSNTTNRLVCFFMSPPKKSKI
jgi:hypothetical protein